MKKKRMVLFKMFGVNLQLDLGYLSEEELISALDQVAKKINIDVHQLMVFTLGTKEESRKKYFCPYCGSYIKEGYIEDHAPCEVCNDRKKG